MKIKGQKLIITILLFSLIVMYGVVSPDDANATSFSGVEDTISDSDPNASAQSVTHTIIATTSLAMDHQDDYFKIDFPADFSDISVGNVTCPSAGTAAVSGNTVTCTYASGLAAGLHEVSITNTTNPLTVGSYLFHMSSMTSTTEEIEKSTFY